MLTATVLFKQFYLILITTGPAPSTPTFLLQPLSFFNLNWGMVGFDWCEFTPYFYSVSIHLQIQTDNAASVWFVVSS